MRDHQEALIEQHLINMAAIDSVNLTLTSYRQNSTVGHQYFGKTISFRELELKKRSKSSPKNSKQLLTAGMIIK